VRRLAAALALTFVVCAAPASAGGSSGAPTVTAVSESEAGLKTPGGLAIHPAGTYLFVADTGNGEVKVLDPGSLRILGAFGGAELAAPVDVTVAPDGTVTVLEHGGASVTFAVRIYRHATEADVIDRTAAVDADAAARLTAVDETGRRAVADPAAGHVVVETADGAFAARIRGGDGVPLSDPQGVEIAGRYVWISDAATHRVRLFRLGGLD
jgi:DNA-binding beta-propeller fold protein YncE